MSVKRKVTVPRGRGDGVEDPPWPPATAAIASSMAYAPDQPSVNRYTFVSRTSKPALR